MIAAAGMGKGVQRVYLIRAEGVAWDEHRARGAEADIAFSFSDGAAADCRGRIISRAGADRHIFGQTELLGNLRQNRSHRLCAFKQTGQLLFADSADAQHLVAPAAVLHIQQQRSGGIGVICGVNAGEPIGDVILRQHDPVNSRELLWLVFAHPKQFWRGKAGKRDVRGTAAKLLPSDGFVEVLHLLLGSAVVPKNCGTDNVAVFVEHHKAVHLAAGADSAHL